jgi:hypothetical protein
MAKIPWEDIFDWAGLMYKRYHGSTLAEAVEPTANQAINPEVPPPEAPVLARAMADLVVSEPFALAVDEAVAGFPKLLIDFISRTDSDGAGIWPTFVFEQLARLYFRRELGGAAATSDSEVAQLVEKGLAADLVRQLQTDVLNAQKQRPPNLQFKMSTGVFYFWTVNESLAWPDVGDLSPGYFPGYYTILDFTPQKAEDAKKQVNHLLARLGRMSQRKKEHLCKMWLSQCDAMMASRRWEPLDTNLPLMKMPLFSALLALERRGAAFDEVQPRFEKMQAAVKALGIDPSDTYRARSATNSMLEAVAEDDSYKFRRSAALLRKEANDRFRLRAKENVPIIEEGIAVISELTGWQPLGPWEV